MCELVVHTIVVDTTFYIPSGKLNHRKSQFFLVNTIKNGGFWRTMLASGRVHIEHESWKGDCFASIVSIFWWACRGPFVCIIDGFSPQTWKEITTKMSPELEGQGFSKKLGSAKKETTHSFVKTTLNAARTIGCTSWNGGPLGAAMSRFPVWCVLCKPRIWIPESVEMSWLCIKPRHDCHQSFCCTSPFQDSRQRRNESLGYQVLLGHNRGMFLHEQPASVIFLSLLQDFQGTLRTYHSPLFCVWGKHIRKPTPELTHLEKTGPRFFGKNLPTSNRKFGEQFSGWWGDRKVGEVSPVFQPCSNFFTWACVDDIRHKLYKTSKDGREAGCLLGRWVERWGVCSQIL